MIRSFPLLVPRYHFDAFVLSPRRRVLLRGGVEQPLIPRYFDLLVFLVEHRHEAVHRREIFDRVWNDVVVSDSALSQAIRTIRRALGDDPRDPRFIRTVSRHGYRFVVTDVREENDDGDWPPGTLAAAPPVVSADAPQAIPLPLPAATASPAIPWTAGAAGGGIAGAMAGLAGGLLLASLPGSAASLATAPALGLIGACCGAAGGAGVAGGCSIAERYLRSSRLSSRVIGGAAGGGLVGTAAQWLGRWSLAALVGVHVEIGGSVEGVIIGAAAGLGYGIASAGLDDAARRARRWRAAGITALICGVAALSLTIAGRPLVGGTVHVIATGSGGSEAALTPLGRLIGEPGFGPISRAIIGTGEAVVFGLGFALGLTRRSR